MQDDIKTSKTLMLFATPLIANNLFTLLPMLFATWLLSHLGKDYLAATAIAMPLFLTIIVFFTAGLSSISIKVAYDIGKSAPLNTDWLQQGGGVAVLSAVMASILLYFAPNLLNMINMPQHVVQLTVPFFVYGALAVWPMFFKVVILEFLVGMGHPRWGLILTLLFTPIELALLYGCVLGRLGLPKLALGGVSVAAFGTDLCFFMAGIVLLFYKYRLPYASLVRPLVRAKMAALWKLGWPIGVQISVELGLLTVLMWILGLWGDDVLAAAQITQQYTMVFLMVLRGMGGALTPLVSRAFGAQNSEEVCALTRVAIVVFLCFLLATSSVLIFEPAVLIDWYLDVKLPIHGPLLTVGVPFMRIAVLYLFFDGIRSLFSAGLRGLHDTKYPMKISTLCFWGISLPLASLMGLGLEQGAVMFRLWYVFGVVVASVLLGKRWYHESHKKAS